MNSIIEINKKKSKAGRTPILMALHKINKDDSEYNKNGITWVRDYCESNIDSIKGMQLVTQFLDDKNEIPFGDHGDMKIIEENKVVFENSLIVGSFEEGYIAENIEVNGEIIDAVVGKGYIYDQRFPALVEYLEQENKNNCPVEGSVEISAAKSLGHNKIIYDGGWKEKGRKPKIFEYSGHALVIGTNSADDSALMLELNAYKNKTKEDKKLEKTIIELNKMEFDDIAKLVRRAFNQAMGENCPSDDEYGYDYGYKYEVFRFYPVTSEVVFSKWRDIGKYYMTTYKIEGTTVTIGEIVKVEEDWKPVSGEQPVEINIKHGKKTIKGGNNMEELIREKDKKIEELTNQIAEINVKNTELTTKVDEFNSKVDELNTTLVEVNKTLEDSKKEKEALTTEVNSLKEYKENKEQEIKKAEVNSYFESEIPKNGFDEVEINSLKDYVEKCDLEGLKKAEADLIVKRFKEGKVANIETNADKNQGVFFRTNEEKIDDIEAGKLLFN